MDGLISLGRCLRRWLDHASLTSLAGTYRSEHPDDRGDPLTVTAHDTGRVVVAVDGKEFDISELL